MDVGFQSAWLTALCAVLVACDRSESATQVGVMPVLERPTQEPSSGAQQGTQLVAVVPQAAALTAGVAAGAACPENMLLVEGKYCPEVSQRCLRYLDPPGRYHEFRCAEYAPSVCLAKQRRPLRFCIDRDEYTEPGEHLPANHRSFSHAARACRAQGKRVCLESEWNFACEGEEMRPYPYGFRRDSSACNADNHDVVNLAGKLRDLRAPGGAYPRCVSPFGVHDMTGNLEEFVAIDGSKPVRPAMKGAYWQPSHNTCRAAQTAHDRYYNGTETGFRCCADAKNESALSGRASL